MLSGAENLKREVGMVSDCQSAGKPEKEAEFEFSFEDEIMKRGFIERFLLARAGAVAGSFSYCIEMDEALSAWEEIQLHAPLSSETIGKLGEEGL